MDELIDLQEPRNSNTRTRYLPVIKHAVPLCPDTDRNCQAEGGSDWWLTCPHDPYFSWQDTEIVTEAVYEPIPNEDGSPSTRKRLVTPASAESVKDRRPNLRQSPVASRHLAGGHLEAKWARRGYKNVDDPLIGLKPFCQMKDCWSQDAKRYAQVFACSEQHARLLTADIEERPLEVLNAKKRSKQLAEMSI